MTRAKGQGPKACWKRQQCTAVLTGILVFEEQQCIRYFLYTRAGLSSVLASPVCAWRASSPAENTSCCLGKISFSAATMMKLMITSSIHELIFVGPTMAHCRFWCGYCHAPK